jgi:hypothetical protein
MLCASAAELADAGTTVRAPIAAAPVCRNNLRDTLPAAFSAGCAGALCSSFSWFIRSSLQASLRMQVYRNCDQGELPILRRDLTGIYERTRKLEASLSWNAQPVITLGVTHSSTPGADQKSP